MKGNRFEEALSLLESASENIGELHNTDWNVLFAVLRSGALLGLNRPSEALNTIARVAVDSESDHATEWSRIVAGIALWMKGVLLIYLKQSEEAISVLLSTLKFINKDDDLVPRRLAVYALVTAEAVLAELKRNEQTITVRERIVDYVHSDDPEELRSAAVRALSINTSTLSDLGRYKEVRDSSDLILDFISVDDSPEIRRFAFLAIGVRLLSESMQGVYEHLAMAYQMVAKYVRRDDPKSLLTMAAMTLTLSGRILIDRERYCEAENVFREASEVDQEHGESWWYRARSILLQGNDERISDAEEFAKRAVELNADSRAALHTLADVLSWKGNWPEALERLEEALRADEGQKERAGREVVDSLTRAAAAGHGARVKQIMRTAGLVESMEPLWHAVRAELGEELEPLPAEVMDAVLLLRGRIAGDPTAAGSSER